MEVLYVDDGTGVWLATQPGELASGYYVQSGVKRQFHIKALNSVAKEQAKAKNTGASSAANPAIPKQSVRAAKQQAFVAQLSAMQVSTPKKDPPKRKETQNKTGLTPDPKKTGDAAL